MSAIITEKFRQHNANQFFESFTETALNQILFVFRKSNSVYSVVQLVVQMVSPPIPGDSPQEEFRAWDAMLAAKNITSTDITFALPRRNWANGTIYDMYQHNYNSDTTSTSGATNLYDSTFFFMTSDYRCL